MSEPLLIITDLEAGYRGKRVVNGVSLSVGEGEIVALVGPNGAGKSTLLKAAFGLLRPTAGRVSFDGRDVTTVPAAARPGIGMGFVPQGSRVFTDLTVRENLEVGGHAVGDAQLVQERMGRAFELFPPLANMQKRLAGTLSGGEQQMLALARALMTEPKLLLVDEPSLGLGPGAARSALDHLETLSRETQTSVLLVEQNVGHALRLADRLAVLVLGEIVLEAPAAELTEGDVREAFFGG